MKSILDSWPHPEKQIRPKQEDSLLWLEEQTATHLILSAPVGVGKSLIAMTYSRWLSANNEGSSYILTPQKVLQKQYEDTFINEMTMSLYGKGNYACASKNTTCDIGSAVKPKCPSCPYSSAFKESQVTPNLILNYKMALLLFSYHPKFSDAAAKKVMVLDECQVLESHLVDFDAININRRFCETKLGVQWKLMDKMADVIEWARAVYLDKLRNYQHSLESEVLPILNGNRKPTAQDVKTVRHYNFVNEHLAEIDFLLHTPLDTLASKRILTKDVLGYCFKSIYARDNMTILDGRAEKYLYMSGTVDQHGFCRDLGIPYDDSAFLALDSEIPKENRPVHFLPAMKVNADWLAPNRKADRDQLIGAVKSILDMHPEDSGVIHTGNFKIADWTVNQLRGYAKGKGLKIFHHNPDEDDSGDSMDRNAAIAAYMEATDNGERAVLISPSCTEGLDLAEDKGRFSIIMKVPFGNLGDEWIKTRMQLSGEWYRRQAVFHVLQACGRVVRSATDKGSTYILDEGWQRLMDSSGSLIPGWWKDGYER